MTRITLLRLKLWFSVLNGVRMSTPENSHWGHICDEYTLVGFSNPCKGSPSGKVLDWTQTITISLLVYFLNITPKFSLGFAFKDQV